MAFSLTQTLRKMKYGEPIVVVSGLPRSGTSMSMKMLEAAGIPLLVDGIRVADEDNPKGYYELERVKELDKGGDKGWLKEARGKAVKIISFLLPELPPTNNYKVIFINRDIQEVLASQAKMLQNREEKSETSDEQMAELFLDHVVKVKRLMRTSDHFECLELKYRDTIENPRRTAEQINEFLGGGFDVETMANVVDSQLYRNRR